MACGLARPRRTPGHTLGCEAKLTLFSRLLGVDPAHQRGGFGSALVRHGIARAEAQNQPIYLEAETAANAPYYEKLGFEALEEATIEAIAVPFSFMIRRSGPAGR